MMDHLRHCIHLSLLLDLVGSAADMLVPGLPLVLVWLVTRLLLDMVK